MSKNDYVPMLIVAINNGDNYIHIRKAKQNRDYYCPCCGSIVKARAMTSHKIQPHFYHNMESLLNRSGEDGYARILVSQFNKVQEEVENA